MGYIAVGTVHFAVLPLKTACVSLCSKLCTLSCTHVCSNENQGAQYLQISINRTQ